MPSPIGEATYKGLAVPAFGDSVIEQENSSNTILTLVHTSANAGSFVQGMDFRADKASSLMTDLALWDVDVDGGFRVLSGTTILFEMNSSGIYQGTTAMVDAGGGTHQVAVTINTTASTLVSSNSGKVHILSTQAATSNFIYLPTAPNARAGDWWDILSNTTAVGLWNLSVNGTSGQLFTHFGTTNTVVTTGAVDTTVTTGGMWWRVVCISTVLPSYALSNMLAPSVAITTAASFYTIGTGTTA